MKIIYEPKIELTAEEMSAVDKVLNLLGQIYQEGAEPMDNDAQNLQQSIYDFCENYVNDYQ